MMMMIIEIMGKVEDSSAYLPFFTIQNQQSVGFQRLYSHLQLLHYPKYGMHACIEMPLRFSGIKRKYFMSSHCRLLH